MIFIDTGAFVARHLPRDQFHDAAVDGWKELARRRWRCLTTNFILDETVTLLARRAGPRFATERARTMLTSIRLNIVRPTPDDEMAALEIMEKFEDHDFSFTDCLSFVTMRARGIESAFAFDVHFVKAGFQLWPAVTRPE